MAVGTSYMPSKKADQVAWAQTFVTVVTDNREAYGVSAAQMTAFTALNATLQSVWALANDVQTRTRVTITDADNALKAMRAAAGGLVSVIQGTPGVTDGMKLAAGLTVRKTTPTKKPVPQVAPYVEVVGNAGRTVTIELRSSRSKRGKPADVATAIVFTHVGPTAPTTQAQWVFAMTTTLTSVKLPFPPSATGDTVWITAFWQNAKGEAGPAATPASVDLPAGGVQPNAAATPKPSAKLRMAA